ncbi:MAG TPA: vitamin K epoxide reductase family protein [Vicinamibacterales bacterium]|nr:vitamin K epoxide reductase family protein [Vicinamibacterales bacterium]
MSKKAAWAALSFSVLGLVVATLASYTHYQILHDPLYSSFCDVNATVSCTQVLSSRFATFRGIPVAIFGAIWFGFAALLSVAGLSAREPVRESIPGYLFAGSTLALAVVLYLGYASFVLLKVACPLCLLTYVAVIGLFLVSGAATSFPMMSLPRRASSDLRVLVSSPVAIVLALLLAGVSVSALALFPREAVASASTASAELEAQARSQVEQFMATEKRVPLVIATQGAKVLIVKFNDYQCPACAASYEMYKPVLAKYQASNPGEVRVVYKDFPLNPSCNETVRQVVHGAACEAAVAVRLAKLKGKGEAMEEWLYTHQEGMTPQSVKQAAREVGQVTDFDAKFQSTLESVKSDVALGKQLNIAQTPTFFINGVQFAGAIRPEFFDQAIAYELQHAGGK